MADLAGRLVLGVTVVVATIAVGTVAQASTWTAELGPMSAGFARSVASPAAPASVSASCVSSTQKLVKVTWSAVSHATYTVYQSNTSATGVYTAVATGLSTTSWTSGALPTGKTYWYEVSAVVGTAWQSASSTATTGLAIKNTAPNCA
jgi:hypothetical protein